MGDIDQITKKDEVIFSPNSPEADLWIKENYPACNPNNGALSFSIPGDIDQIEAFRKAAEESRFSLNINGFC